MKYLALILALFVTACGTLQVPISQFDTGVAEVCEQGSGRYEYNGKPYTLHLTDDTDQLYDWCGKDKYGNHARACIKNTDIYAPAGPTCPGRLAHEIGHLVGMAGMDRPQIGVY